MWKRRKSIGRVILLIDNRSTVRPLFDRDNRLAIIGGLAAAVPVRSKVTRQFRLLPPRRPTYGLTDLSPWKLISSGRGFPSGATPFVLLPSSLPNFIEISTKFLRDNPREREEGGNIARSAINLEGEKNLLRFNSIPRRGEKFSTKFSAPSSSSFSTSFFPLPTLLSSSLVRANFQRNCTLETGQGTRKGREYPGSPTRKWRVTIRPLLIKGSDK